MHSTGRTNYRYRPKSRIIYNISVLCCRPTPKCLQNNISEAIVSAISTMRKENIKVKLFQKESGFAHMMVIVVVAALAVGIIGGIVYERAHADSYHCYPKTYSTNGVGTRACVRTIQEMLNISTGKSFAAHGGFDGVYGQYTKSVVVYFQKTHGLGGEADGIIGSHTWAKLCFADVRAVTRYNTLKALAGCPVANSYHGN